MISNAFKKQLIVNNYKTQLLPVSDRVKKTSIDANERAKNLLLFRINELSSLRYKHKTIEFDINWYSLSYSLTTPIYLIYKYSENKKYNIEDSPDYTEYMEEVYD